MAPRSILSAVLVWLVVACGPVVMIPGGELSGEVAPPPADWSFTDSVKDVQLETRPGDPYSVNVWGVAAGPELYIASGDRENRWARHIAADPRVRLRVGETLFELRAEPTDDPAHLEAFLAAAQRKYDFTPEPEQRANAQLYRLLPR